MPNQRQAATPEDRAGGQLVDMLHNSALHQRSSRTGHHFVGWTPEGAAVACAAASALGQVGGGAALEALVESLIDNGGDARAVVREAVARALNAFAVPKAADALVVALKDRDPNVRREAAISLRCIKDGRALGTLKVVAETDPSPAVRYQANWAASVLECNPKGMETLAPPLSAQIVR